MMMMKALVKITTKMTATKMNTRNINTRIYFLLFFFLSFLLLFFSQQLKRLSGLKYAVFNFSLIPCLLGEHCTVEQKDYFTQLYASVKTDIKLDIPFLLKCPFRTVFGKIYRPTKSNLLGTWEVSILFRNSWRFFFVLYRGTLK